MHFHDVKTILSDPSRPAPERLLRLQGWRGAELDQAVAAGAGMRLGPAACTALGVAGLVTRSPLLYAALAAASAVGVFARNHPVELLWVRWARRHGRAVPPCNRMGRRFACLVAAMLFALAGIGAAAGVPALLYVAGITMVVVPLFVAATNLCLPSLVLTLLVGADRVARSGATCPSPRCRTCRAESWWIRQTFRRPTDDHFDRAHTTTTRQVIT